MLRAFKNVVGTIAGVLLLFAGVTAVGDFLIDWANPPIGQFIDTSSGRQHVLDVGPEDKPAQPTPAIVLVHGANSNLGDMRLALVARLRSRNRVIAIDRPGHGWSERAGGAADAAPRRQAAVVREVLSKLGVTRPVLLGHSWAGALAAAYALDYPGELHGLVLLAPATHPWATGVPWHFGLAGTPWLGPLFARTLAQPLGYLMLDRFVGPAFAPQGAPPDYVERASISLALRPATVMANGEDLNRLEAFVAAQATRYELIKTRTVVITGTADGIVSPRIHARAIAAQIPAAQLVVLQGIGHMPHHADTARVVAAIEALAAADQDAAAAPRATHRP